jgi:hypothetical protein
MLTLILSSDNLRGTRSEVRSPRSAVYGAPFEWRVIRIDDVPFEARIRICLVAPETFVTTCDNSVTLLSMSNGFGLARLIRNAY